MEVAFLRLAHVAQGCPAGADGHRGHRARGDDLGHQRMSEFMYGNSLQFAPPWQPGQLLAEDDLVRRFLQVFLLHELSSLTQRQDRRLIGQALQVGAGEAESLAGQPFQVCRPV